MSWKQGTAANHLDFMDTVKGMCLKTSFVDPVSAWHNAGNGEIEDLTPIGSLPKERWTLVCTTGGGDGVAIFSVTGSISGAQTAATCNVPYTNTFMTLTVGVGVDDYVIGDRFIFDVESGVATDVRYNNGTGIVFGHSATDESVDETWTMVCTTGGNNNIAIFSVTGSVSGAKPDCTCGVPYSEGLLSFTVLARSEDFVIGDTFSFDIVSGTPEWDIKMDTLETNYTTEWRWETMGGLTSIGITKEDPLYTEHAPWASNPHVFTDEFDDSDFSISMWLLRGNTGYVSTGLNSHTFLLGDSITPYLTPWIGAARYWNVGNDHRGHLRASLVNYYFPNYYDESLLEWVHFVFTYDKTTRLYSAYADGNFLGATTLDPKTVTANILAFSCGRNLATSNYLNNYYRDIQTYLHVLTPTEVSDLHDGSIATASGIQHHWKLDEMNGNGEDSVGSLDIILGEEKKSHIYEGKGDSGSESILVGMQAVSDSFSYANIRLQGFTGFVSTDNLFDHQLGAIPADETPILLSSESPFQYMLLTTNHNIIAVTRIGTTDQSCILGWYNPIFSVEQWGNPLCVGGCHNDLAATIGDTTDSHKAWFKGGTLALRILNPTEWVDTVAIDPVSYSWFSSIDITFDTFGNIPCFPYAFFETTAKRYHGTIPKVTVPVRSGILTSGDYLLSLESIKLVLQDTFRGGAGDLLAFTLQ